MGKKVLKVISLISIFTILHADLCFAFEIPHSNNVSSHTPSLDLTSFKIPDSLGTIYRRQIKSDKSPTIILIQDAHAIVEAQTKIRDILLYLENHYGIHNVGAEGLSGTMDATLFQTFPDKELLKKSLLPYLDRGEITGTALAKIESTALNVFGIESWELYIENILLANKALRDRPARLAELENYREKLFDSNKGLFDQAQTNFLEKSYSYKTEKISLDEFLAEIHAFHKSFPKHSNSSRFRELDEFISLYNEAKKDTDQALLLSLKNKAQKLDRSIPQEAPIAERMAWQSAYQNFLTEKAAALTFAETLSDFSIRFGIKLDFSASEKKLIKLQREIQKQGHSPLLDHLEQYLKSTLISLAQTRPQKEWLSAFRQQILLHRLARLQLGSNEFQELLHQYPLYASDPKWKGFIRYYEYTIKRDAVIVKKTKAFQKKEKCKALALTTGGFHTENLIQNFAPLDWNIIVIMPRVMSLEGLKTYENLLQGRYSYKKLLQDSYYKAFARHWILSLIALSDLESFSQIWLEWRKNIIAAKNLESQNLTYKNYLSHLDFGLEALVKNHRIEDVIDSFKEYPFHKKIKKISQKRVHFKPFALEPNLRAAVVQLVNPNLDPRATTPSQIEPTPVISLAENPPAPLEVRKPASPAASQKNNLDGAGKSLFSFYPYILGGLKYVASIYAASIALGILIASVMSLAIVVLRIFKVNSPAIWRPILYLKLRVSNHIDYQKYTGSYHRVIYHDIKSPWVSFVFKILFYPLGLYRMILRRFVTSVAVRKFLFELPADKATLEALRQLAIRDKRVLDEMTNSMNQNRQDPNAYQRYENSVNRLVEIILEKLTDLIERPILFHRLIDNEAEKIQILWSKDIVDYVMNLFSSGNLDYSLAWGYLIGLANKLMYRSLPLEKGSSKEEVLAYLLEKFIERLLSQDNHSARFRYTQKSFEVFQYIFQAYIRELGGHIQNSDTVQGLSEEATQKLFSIGSRLMKIVREQKTLSAFGAAGLVVGPQDKLREVLMCLLDPEKK